MNNVHDDAPVVFQTRWAMSYLRGPLTRDQIKTLMDPVRSQFVGTRDRDGAGAAAERDRGNRHAPHKPLRAIAPSCRPASANSFCRSTTACRTAISSSTAPACWATAKCISSARPTASTSGASASCCNRSLARRPTTFGTAPSSRPQRLDTEDQPDDTRPFRRAAGRTARDKSYSVFRRQLKEHLYREAALQAAELRPARRKLEIRTNRESDFRTRLAPLLATAKAAERAKLEKQYATKLADARRHASSRPRPASARSAGSSSPASARMLWVIADTVHERHGQGPARPTPLARSGISLRRHRDAASSPTPKSASTSCSTKRSRSKQNATRRSPSLDAKFTADRVPLE